MIKVGSRVTVKDNYAGGLDDVIGKTAKVVYIQRDKNPAIQSNIELNIRGSKTETRKGYYGRDDYEYTSDYPVIVTSDEIEENPIEFKDMDGNLVEIGDKVAYAVYGGGLTRGTVIDIKDEPEGHWGTHDVKKVKIEIDDTNSSWDGGKRKVTKPYKRTFWYANSQQMLILQKHSVTRLDFTRTSELNIIDG